MAEAAGSVGGAVDTSSEEVSLEDAIAELGGDPSALEEEESTEETTDDDDDGDLETDDDDAEEDSEEGDDKKGDGEEESLKDFIDQNYQGDEAKFLKGLRENWKHSAEVAKKLDRLEQLLATQSEKADPEPEPDLSQFDEELKELEEEYNAGVSQRETLLTDISRLAAQENKLQGQLEVLDSDDSRRASMEQRLYGIQRDISSKSDSYKGIERDLKKLERQGRAVNRKKSEEAERQKRQLVESRRASKAGMQTAHRQVDSTIDALFEKHEIPEEYHADLGRTIKSEVINYLSALPEDQGPADLEKVTQEVGSSLLGIVNKMSRAKLSKGSSDKLKASRSGNTSKTPKRPVKKDKPLKTAEDWRSAAAKARAETRKLLGD